MNNKINLKILFLFKQEKTHTKKLCLIFQQNFHEDQLYSHW